MPKTCPTCDSMYPDAMTFCPKDGSGLRATVAKDDLIGEVIAERYLVTDLLGEGGMGMVYLAQHVRLPQQAAIKILRAASSNDPAQSVRFRQEAEAASRIANDRVARVFDFGTTPSGDAYIAMEYVPGRTLKRRLDDQGAMDPGEAAQIIAMIAEGLDAAHRIGIVHRDLKPENIMIVEDAEAEVRVKVLDFGIAKMANADASSALTQVGFIIGTPAYMSPEQVRGETLDARSDVYALGLLAYLCLTGRLPFAGNTPESEMIARLTNAPTALSSVRPDIAWPADLQDLLNRVLAPVTSDRPSTASAFARELTHIITTWRGATFTPTSAATVSPALPSRGSASGSGARVAVGSTANGLNEPKQSRGALYAVGGVVAVALVLGALFYNARKPDGSAPAVGSTASAADPSAPTPTSTPSTGADRAVPSATTSTSPSLGAAPVSASNSPATSPSSNGDRTPTNNRPAGGTSAPGVAGTQAGRPAGTPSGTPVAASPTTPVEKAPGAAAPTGKGESVAREELDAIMSRVDGDGGQFVAQDAVRKLEALKPRLSSKDDQAWAEVYLGMSLATLNESAKACAAFERASALGGTRTARKLSIDWREKLRCVPG